MASFFYVVHAENSDFQTQLNRTLAGLKCHSISIDDIRKSPLGRARCSRDELIRLRNSKGDGSESLSFSEHVLHRLVFSQAARRQLPKDRCLVEKMAAINSDPKSLAHYTKAVILAWLRQRKMQLYNRACNQTTVSVDMFDPNSAGGKQFQAQYGKQIALANHWRSICQDPKTRAALASYQSLALYSLPTVVTPEVFKAMDSVADAIVDKKTGKPVGDRYFALSDTRNPQVQVSRDQLARVQAALKGVLANVQTERQGMVDKIRATAAGNQMYDLPDELRDYVFDEGTVYEVLDEQGLLSNSTKELPLADCVTTRYEAQSNTQLAEVGYDVVTLGAAAGLVQKGTRAIKGLSSLVQARRMGVWGLSASEFLTTSKEIYKSCLPGSGYKSRRLPKVGQEQDTVVDQASNLPVEIDYTRFNLPLPPGSTPSCREDAIVRQETDYDRDCLAEVVDAALPAFGAELTKAVEN